MLDLSFTLSCWLLGRTKCGAAVDEACTCQKRTPLRKPIHRIQGCLLASAHAIGSRMCQTTLILLFISRSDASIDLLSTLRPTGSTPWAYMNTNPPLTPVLLKFLRQVLNQLRREIKSASVLPYPDLEWLQCILSHFFWDFRPRGTGGGQELIRHLCLFPVFFRVCGFCHRSNMQKPPY